VPRGSNTKIIAGPWLGMEERENYQTDNHCQLAFNVDFSRGYIEAREGLDYMYGGLASKSRLHVHNQNGKPKYLLAIGPFNQIETANIVFVVLDANNPKTAIGSAQDVTSELGEPADEDFQCSFVSAILTRKDSNGQKTEPHHVTLIMTKHRTYIYDPIEDELNLQAVNMDDDAIRLNSINWGYWNIVPGGHIATEHQSRVYYAGFPENYEISLTSPLDELQSLIPSMLINEKDKSKMRLGPQFIAWSDEFDPFGIVAYHFLAVEEHETITGLKSFQEQLVIFTDRSIYVKTGGSDETFQVFKVVSDVGCIAPNSIVEVSGVLMFMARDGIYAFTGAGQQGAVQKISKPIDSIFNGRTANTYIPEKARTALYNRGWPFSAKKVSLELSNAVHIQGKNQILWSLDIEKTQDQGWELAVVYDYAHQAWSLYGHGVEGRSPFFDGVTVSIGGDERVFFSAGDGKLYEHTGSYDDNISGVGVKKNIPMIYITGRLFKTNTGVNLYRPMRLKLLSWGDSTKLTNPPFWMAYGEEAHGDAQYKDSNGSFQLAESTDRQYTEGEITLHPAEEMGFFYGVGTYKDSEVIGTGNGSNLSFSATVNFNFDLPTPDHSAPYWTDVAGGHFLTFTTGLATKTIYDTNNTDFNDSAEIASSSWNKTTGAVSITFAAGYAPDGGTSVIWGVDGGKSIPYQDTDWFTSKIEGASIRSRSLRMAFFSGHSDTVNEPEIVLQNIAVDVTAGDSR